MLGGVPRRRRAGVYALAAAGVVVAHAVDYMAVFPHAHGRNAHLAESGHRYWPVATALALIAAAAVLGLSAGVGLEGPAITIYAGMDPPGGEDEGVGRRGARRGGHRRRRGAHLAGQRPAPGRRSR